MPHPATPPSTPPGPPAGDNAFASSLFNLGDICKTFLTVIESLDRILDEHDRESCVDCMTRTFEVQRLDDAAGADNAPNPAAGCAARCPWSYLSFVATSIHSHIPVILPDFSAGCILPTIIEPAQVASPSVETTAVVVDDAGGDTDAGDDLNGTGGNLAAAPTPQVSSRASDDLEADRPAALLPAPDVLSTPSMSSSSVAPVSVSVYPLLAPGTPIPVLPPPPATHFGAGVVARRAITRTFRCD